jgi:hypothetical protein
MLRAPVVTLRTFITALAFVAAFAPNASHADPTDAPVDVANYTLRARLDVRRHEVAGDGTLRWRNTARVAVQALWFHLYLNAFDGPRTLFARTAGASHRGNSAGRNGRIDLRTLTLSTGEDLLVGATNDPAVPDDRTQLYVRLPRPVAPGESIELSMAWTSVLPEVYARTGYRGSFHMVGQWFPKIAVLEGDGTWSHFAFHGNSEFYADFGRYDVTVTAPRGFVLGATGTRGTVEHGADGERHHFTAERVHDFAFTAWDHFRERRDVADETTLRVLYPPGLERVAERSVACLRRAMPAYARRFGPYPYAGLTVVIPPRDAEGAGGMEYPTLITTGGDWYTPEGVRDVEMVTLHEFMHQYFYGMLASNEHDWAMLDEGFTEYATALGFEDLYGYGAEVIDLTPLGLRVSAFALDAMLSGSIERPVAVATASSGFTTSDAYGSHVYARTATTLRTAERFVGRERFRHAMHTYAERWRFRHPTPDDFFAVMRETLGDGVVDELLRPALTVPAQLDYAVTVAESRHIDGRYRGRVVLERSGTLVLPVDVVIENAHGTRRTVRWNARDAVTELPYDDVVRLHAVRIDPSERVPLDARRLNNARLAHGASPPPPVAAVARVAYWLGLALQMVGP